MQFVSDKEIDIVVLDINSPGGSSFGVDEFSNRVKQLSEVKPIYSLVNHLAASAAYYIASGSTAIIGLPDSFSGSIGTYMLHFDISKMLADFGVKPTFIYSGKYKVEGNSFEPLTNEAKDRFQSIVDTINADFIKAVAKNRGISVASVQNDFGQGRVLTAKEALQVGMIDRIETMDSFFGKVLAKSVDANRIKMTRQDNNNRLKLLSL